nr:uncharacterized protein LOC127327064 [Lolium perenne]
MLFLVRFSSRTAHVFIFFPSSSPSPTPPGSARPLAQTSFRQAAAPLPLHFTIHAPRPSSPRPRARSAPPSSLQAASNARPASTTPARPRKAAPRQASLEPPPAPGPASIRRQQATTHHPHALSKLAATAPPLRARAPAPARTSRLHARPTARPSDRCAAVPRAGAQAQYRSPTSPSTSSPASLHRVRLQLLSIQAAAPTRRHTHHQQTRPAPGLARTEFSLEPEQTGRHTGPPG